ncbi:hypothetical protein [Spirosoma linguale]|uniref:Wadjet protein JetD C-terminal domain-containing protein n=1 Tax=Spirosoma linguale (strain ATCC 33905 / DSM 74 / LMG 10896 / Claus 1) TaxID=504472 RepID=D2QNM2_SPILD|nr:hypothetical protein Slin_4579 [Spirosoma linguale DSM 74]
MRKISWGSLKRLHDLYTNRKSTAALNNDSFIYNHFMVNSRMIRKKRGGQKTPVWEPTPQFDWHYERWHKDKYLDFKDFFEKSELPHTALQDYEEDDIATLVFVYNNREEILKGLTTERTFLKEIFKKAIDEERESKYFIKHISLKNAVLKLLGREKEGFPDDDPKDHQWRFVVDCPTAEYVVLCENLNMLKLPRKALEHNIELWHVGGGNTKPVERLGSRQLNLPLFYSCDWDYHGLEIYSRIKRLLKGYKVELLMPRINAQRFDTKTEYHSSEWNFNIPFSGLERDDFSTKAQLLIEELIRTDKWIEEEGNDVVEMIFQII